MNNDERWTVTGTWTGKSAFMRRYLDRWLMEHPYQKALVIDPKGGQYTRHFEPHVLQITERKKSNGNG